MNRTDRLAALVMLLQSQRVITAAEMAGHFGITERTVYRDLAALSEAGVPILGEAGVGYSLRRGYHLPPVMFSPAEAQALATGGMLAERMTDPSMAISIRLALAKITAVLPPDVQDQVQRLRRAMLVRTHNSGNGPVPLSRLQMAMAGGQLLRLRYLTAKTRTVSQRDVEPLGLVYYLDYWHLIGWCRLRGEVRDFRADRILDAEVLSERVSPRPGFDLAAHLQHCLLPEDDTATATLLLTPRLLETIRRHWGPALQSEEPAGDHIQISLRYPARDVRYLASWLLGFGLEVRILKPIQLRQTLVHLAREAIRHHQPEGELVPPLLT